MGEPKLVFTAKLLIPLTLPCKAAMLCPKPCITQGISCVNILLAYKAAPPITQTPSFSNPSMESVGSNSPCSAAAAADRYNLAQHVADRIIRALRHPLRLIHRSGADFFVLGSTGNVYKVTLGAAPSCTCPDRAVPCKHILFVLLRVLGCSFDDACVWRRALPPCQLARLLSAPTAADVMAGARARERFHQLFSGTEHPVVVAVAERGPEEGAVCPVCLEEMAGGGEGVASCGSCGNSLHEECLARWKRIRGRRGVSCVMCRARWRRRRRRRREEEPYVNLAAYVGDEDDDMAVDSGVSCAGG